MTTNDREADAARAQARAFEVGSRAAEMMRPTVAGGTPAAGRALFKTTLAAADRSVSSPNPPVSIVPIGTMMSELVMHGGINTFSNRELMASRFSGLMAGLAAGSAPNALMLTNMTAAMDASRAVPTFFFYHLVNRPYKLHSQLVSYLTHPARHLRSPVSTPPDGPGRTYDQNNLSSPTVPAAATFIGQFIDHDMTLNAMNLLDPQAGSDVRTQASPLIDLDSVYGPRLDDGSAVQERMIPMSGGKFCLRPVTDTAGAVKGYDVCRQRPSMKALIGDKRNDENQIILQVHILAMRLHNHFMHTLNHFGNAKRQTLLHWQAMVATYYLPLIAQPRAIDAVKHRLLTAPLTLCHRPGLTVAGGTTLGMPHEFAIGFRFGHSQLRSEYKLNPQHDAVRLFDPLATGVPLHDLQGGKPLDAERLIDWRYFSNAGNAPSNQIDTKVTEDVFALPESTIPDQVPLVSNLPLRNLIRSDALGLCAGEDLARCYSACYPDLLPPEAIITGDKIDDTHAELFRLDPKAAGPEFRTPLWYYLPAEAEHHHKTDNDGRLGMTGSLLIAEVLLSGIKYAVTDLRDPEQIVHSQPNPCRSGEPTHDTAVSIFDEPTAGDPEWLGKFKDWKAASDHELVGLVDLVGLIERTNVVPPQCPM